MNQKKDYLAAVWRVLNGQPVKNLEKIRTDCNKRCHGDSDRYPQNRDAMIINSVSKAENAINKGAHPNDVYKMELGFSVDYR